MVKKAEYLNNRALYTQLKNHKLFPLALYIVALLCALFSVNYFHYLHNLPRGEHFWRQTDSGSFVTYYYNHGMNFFNTGTYNLKPLEGRAASEFPILYYITAALWHVFGRSEATLKIIDSIIVFTGFYCFFKIAYKQLKNIFIALLITIVLLSSPMLLSYTNNFLPDPPALGLAFIGLYFFFLFTETKKYKHYLWCIFFLGFSSLIKISFAIAPLSVIALLFSEKFIGFTFSNKKLFEKSTLKYLFPFIISFSILMAWTLWTMHYNKINSSEIFLAGTNTYWEQPAEHLKIINSEIINYWQPYYYYYSTLHVFIILAILGVLLIWKWDKLSATFMALLMAGSVCYSLLFYGQFGPHDYYMIIIIMPVAFLIMFSLKAVLKFGEHYHTVLVPTIIIGLLVLNVLSYIFSNKTIAIHKGKGKTFISLKDPELLFGKMENFGVPKEGVVYSFPDCSPNGSLYFLDRKGYTDWHNFDSTAIQANLKEFIPKGVEYLVISNPEYYRYAKTNWFDSKMVGKCDYIQMYKITRYDTTKWINNTQ